MRECEVIIKECILNVIRESIPIEKILRSYIDKTTETEVTVEEEIVQEEKKPEPKDSVVEEKLETSQVVKHDETIVKHDEEAPTQQKSVALSFNDMDKVLNMSTNQEENIDAPKTIDRLETISNMRNEERKRDEEEEDDIETLTINSDLDPNELDGAIESLDDELMKLSASVEDDDLGIQMLE
jgi:deoxyribodipyrimidine photolyase